MPLCRGLPLGVLLLFATAFPAGGSLIIHFDPNDSSTLFQDGGANAGSVPVTAVGQSVGWITDARSPTPGGGSLDGFVDAQQSGGGADLPTLANSPGGTVLNFAGADNLVGFDTNIIDIDGVLGAMDTDTATLILVGRADAGSSLDTFIDFRTGASGLGGFGLRYNHGTGNLEGLVDTATVAATALSTDVYFVATLVWDGLGGTASLRVTTAGSDVTTVDNTASSGPIDHERFRLGSTANGGNWLEGQIGDVYVYDDISDHSAVHDGLFASYVPEPGTGLLVGLGLAGLAAVRRSSATAR